MHEGWGSGGGRRARVKARLEGHGKVLLCPLPSSLALTLALLPRSLALALGRRTTTRNPKGMGFPCLIRAHDSRDPPRDRASPPHRPRLEGAHGPPRAGAMVRHLRHPAREGRALPHPLAAQPALGRHPPLRGAGGRAAAPARLLVADDRA